MNALIAQIIVVVKMNIQSLPKRGLMALVTLVAVAVVVTIFLAFMAMGDGFKSTMQNSGSNELGIALRAASQSELNSGLGADQVKLFVDAPGIASGIDGPIVSAELYVIVDGIKKATGTSANLSLRGIGEQGIDLRPNVTLVDGRMFIPGKNEVVVGAAVARDFEGFDVGSKLKLGTATWTVVGLYTANGSVYESEVWTDVRTVQTQFNRGNSYQTVRFKLETPDDVSKIKAYVDANPQLNLDIKTEQEYFSEQGSAISQVVIIGWVLSVVMALGSLSGALNSMYTSVAQRTREIATLRAIGFRGTSAFVGTLVESIVLSVLGGLLGTILAYVFFNGMTGATLGGNFTQVVFEFKITADSFKNGIIIALTIGLVGGFFPALKAARIPVLKAFSLDS